MMHSSTVVALLLACVASTSCMLPSPGQEGSPNYRTGGRADLNIVEVADRLGAYNFLYALKETNLMDTIRNAHDITVFVPTNAAFNALSGSTRQFLRQNPAAYVEILKYHVVQGLFPANQLNDEQVLTTVGNYKTRFTIYNHTKMANISLYQGSVLNAANNFSATNGIIHFIDSVVVQTQSNLNTLEVALSNPNLTKLVQLVKSIGAAKFNPVLTNTSSPHTLFAPNDEAFQKLPAGTFDRLLQNATLAEAVVRRHISDFGAYFSNGLIDGEVIPTANFTHSIIVNKDTDGTIRLDNKRSTVVMANNATSTGVIHVIDNVLTD